MNLDGRIHFLDAARAILMLLGIPYHVALVYMIGNDWDFANSDERSGVLTVFAEFIHIFRMPLFFLVSGYFSMLILSKSTPGRWFGGRIFKLGIPLLAVGILLNPVALLVQPDAVELLTDFGDHWLAHLWFLPTLLYFCAFLALLQMTPLQAWFQRFVDWIADRPILGTMLFIALGGCFSGAGSLLENRIPDVFLIRLTVSAAVGFLPYMMLGAALRLNPKLLASMSRSWMAGLAIAIVPLLFLMNVTWGSTLVNLSRVFAGVIVCFGFACVLLTFCRITLDSPSKPVRRISDASFSIYLFHLPLLNVCYLVIEPASLPIHVEFAVVTVIVLVGCYAAHLLIVRSNLLMFLFNGAKWRRRQRGDEAPAIRA